MYNINIRIISRYLIFVCPLSLKLGKMFTIVTYNINKFQYVKSYTPSPLNAFTEIPLS